MTPGVRGVTLIEVLVALVVLGLMASLVAARIPAGSPQDPALAALRTARAQAVREGRAIVVLVADTLEIRFAPEGSSSGGRWCAGASCWTVDRWTGRVRSE